VDFLLIEFNNFLLKIISPLPTGPVDLLPLFTNSFIIIFHNLPRDIMKNRELFQSLKVGFLVVKKF
jgi:hypothetical protein